MPDNRFYELKDSGQRKKFETGAVRDVDEEKPRYDLIPIEVLEELAIIYTKGAKKYNERNWQKGIPLSRYFGSFMRHFMASLRGKTDENHEAAMLFNVVGYVWTLRQVQKNKLPKSLDDRNEML